MATDGVRCLVMLFAVALACNPGGERTVAVVHGADPGGNTYPHDTSDTGSFDSADTAGAAPAPPLDCQATDRDAPGTTLALDWCHRLTPEAAWPPLIGDTSGSASDTGIPGPVAPPPCGYENLVGNVAIAGASGSPMLLYCDADADGGVRTAHMEGEDAVRVFLGEGQCTPDPSAGDLMAVGEGYVAGWAAYSSEKAEEPTIQFVHVAADGSPTEPITRPEAAYAPSHLSFVGGDAPWVLSTDFDGDLYANSLDSSTLSLGPSLALGAATDAVGVGFGSGIAVATCSDAEPPALLTLAGGEIAAKASVSEGVCGWNTHPSLATDGSRLLMGWDDGLWAYWALYDANLGLITSGSLAEYAWHPQAARTASGWAIFSGDGSLLVLNDDGSERGTWWHPYASRPKGSDQTVRFAADGDSLTFVYEGLTTHPIGGGHVNTYNFVEVSSATLP